MIKYKNTSKNHANNNNNNNSEESKKTKKDNTNSKNKEKRSDQNRKVTIILGDSMVKNIYGGKLSKTVKREERIIVKSFPGATSNCMKHYITPSLNKKPDCVIFHIGVP